MNPIWWWKVAKDYTNLYILKKNHPKVHILTGYYITRKTGTKYVVLEALSGGHLWRFGTDSFRLKDTENCLVKVIHSTSTFLTLILQLHRMLQPLRIKTRIILIVYKSYVTSVSIKVS